MAEDNEHVSPSDAELNSLLEHYQNGRYGDAEKLGVTITQEFPKHQFAWKVLGALFKLMGRMSEALFAKQKAVELNSQDAEAHNNLANTLQELGRLDEAEASYSQAITLKPDYAEAHSNLGVTLQELGRLDEAEASYNQAITLKPDYAEAHSNLGVTLQELGRLDEAEASYNQAIALKPNYTQAYCNLGNTLQKNGKLDEAEASHRQAIALKPDYAEAHSNLGSTLQELGRLEEAEASYSQAIALKPDYAEAHNNLANTLQKLGRLEEAEASYNQAIALKPDYAQAYCNLGNTLQKIGKLDEAIEKYKQSIALKPDYSEAYLNIGIALTDIEVKKPILGLPELICELLEKKVLVSPQILSRAAISLLKFDPTIKGAMKQYSDGELVQSLQEIIVSLSHVPLLLRLMKVCPLPDLRFESLFKDIRSAVLLSVSNIKNNTGTLIFQIALALHCFTNEYLYDQTDLEIEALKELEKLVDNKLTAGQHPSPVELACLASYKALHEYSWAQLITMPAELKELECRQIIEPEEEKKLRSKMPRLQEITDNVSTKVREQYEHNPYPRWVNLGLPLNPKPISTIVKETKLKITNTSINTVSNPKILVAGCGTGQHSIFTASRFKDCHVLAIDLSVSSLAYAKRKTEELGITNIEYMQADILDLGSLNRQFDIIESAGVLHHMDEPMAGWKVLTSCLKTGGLMNIGLYSELARQDIVRMRNEIEQSRIKSNNDAMRSFRNKVVRSEEKHHKEIVFSPDLYSMSTLRDLLFHVQEHRFTIPQIKNSLAQLELVFCGFQSKKIMQKFKLKGFAEDAVLNLDSWEIFERENPRTFSGMYQFVCQKL